MHKKLIKPALILGGLLAFYALSGFLLVPYLLKAQLPARLSQQTNTPVTLKDATFNPFKLELTLSGFELKDKQKKTFLKFDELLVDVGGFDSLKNLTFVIEQLRTDKLQALIAMFKNGQFNFQALFPPDNSQPPEEQQAGLPVLFKQIQFNEGSLTWEDQRLSKPESASLTPINFTLTDLSLRQDKTAKFIFSTALAAGGKIDWQLELSLKPLASKGQVQFKAIKAERLWALLLQEQVNFKIPQGESDLSFSYDLAYDSDKLRLNISDGVFVARKLQLTALDNPKPLLTMPEVAINGIQFDLAKQAIAIKAVSADAIHLALASDAEGAIDLQKMFAPKAKVAAPPPATTPPAKSASPEQPWLINIAKIALHQLQADYQGQSAEIPLQAHWKALDIDIADAQLDISGAQTHVQTKTGKVLMQGLEVRDVKLQNNSAPLQIKNNHLQIALGNFQLDTAVQPMQILAEQGNIQIRGFNFQEQDAKQALISFPQLIVNEAKLDLAKQQVDIAKLQASGAKFRAWLNPDGQLNYISMFAGEKAKTQIQAAPQQSPSPLKDSAPWVFTLAALDLQNFQLDMQDKTHAQPVVLQLADLNFKADHLSNQKSQKLPFTLRTKINQAGSLAVKGQAVLDPLKADLQATLINLGLKSFQPYLNDYARVDIITGGIDTTANIALRQPNTKANLDIKIKGKADIKELLTRDQILNKDLVKWQSVKLGDIDVDSTPLKINIGNILLQEPYARVTIKKDRSLNFEDIFVKQPAPASAATASKTVHVDKTVAPQYKIAAVTIANGKSDFSDFSLILPFVVELNELNGAVKGFSSQQKQLADFNMTGKVFDLSPMEMNSQFSPDFSQLNVGMHFKGMPLPFVSPYMAEFAGYKIEKGKMSLDLLYKIADRKLTAENNLVLDQLTLGEKIENPKATSLPLSLAIALLKDSNGKININLPLTGSLDDPQFSVGALVFDAFVNMLTKVISSPFKALGALTSSAEDFSQVSFKEGSNVVSEPEQAKLLELAKGLTEKTDLSIEIKGSAYTKQDWPALQDDALLDQLKAIKAAELKSKGKNQRAEYVELSEGDAQQLQADLFIKKFPHLGKRSLFGTPELIGSDKDFETVAKRQLMAIIPPDQQRLAALAATRARNIAQVLIQKGKISQERIFILDANVQPESAQQEIISELSLTVH